MKDVVNIELLKIHNSFKLDYQITINTDEFSQAKFQNINTINKFSIKGGNTYIKINPAAFLIIDIQTKKDKKEFYNPFGTFPLTKKSAFFLLQKLKRLYKKMKDPEIEMFYLVDGILKVNKQEAQKAEEVLLFESTTSIDKQLHIFPFVVEDKNQRYEGVYIYINDYPNGTSITFMELELVIDTIQKLDFSSLSMKLIVTYLLMKNEESNEIEFHNKPLIESKEEIIHGETTIKVTDTNKIPDI